MRTLLENVNLQVMQAKRVYWVIAKLALMQTQPQHQYTTQRNSSSIAPFFHCALRDELSILYLLCWWARSTTDINARNFSTIICIARLGRCITNIWNANISRVRARLQKKFIVQLNRGSTSTNGMSLINPVIKRD